MPSYIFIIIAFILALLSALNVASRFNLVGAALASYFLSLLIAGSRALFVVALCGCLLLSGCANMTPQQQAIASSAETFASIAATAAATYYGGPEAGQLASNGLSALGSVLQGYVGATVPQDIVKASPGISGVGIALASLIPPNQPISQKTVNTVHRAAVIAATLRGSDILPIATPAPTGS